MGLLTITEEEWKKAEEFFKSSTEIKMSKGFSSKTDKEKKEHSFIKVGNTIYAMAVGTFLGQGNFGNVKIVQDRDGNNYAVKVEAALKKEDKSDNAVRARAMKEAEISIMTELGQLKGTATRTLPKEKDFKKKTKVTEKFYSIMNLLEGSELKKVLDSLTQQQKWVVAAECCLAVQNLHERRIVHADIKPENFMYNQKGEQIFILPMDFGLSLKLDLNKTNRQTGYARGTKPYMAQEVLSGGTLSFSSDIFSLGKMFEQDLKLPKEIWEGMIIKETHTTKRKPLSEVFSKIVEHLSKEPKPEAATTKFLAQQGDSLRQRTMPS